MRPRNIAVKQQLRAAVVLEKQLEAALKAPAPKPLGRFLAHYNLSIRYWDLGKAKQALHEAEMACEELERHGISGGCAEHNRRTIEIVQTDWRAQEKELAEAVRRNPQAVEPNYRLGELFFDKRMLLRAETQLRWTMERASAANALRRVARDSAYFERAKWAQARQLATRSGKSIPAPPEPLHQRPGAVKSMKTFELTAAEADLKLGISPCGAPPDAVIVGKVKPGSWADAAGLRPDDEVLSVNGRSLCEFDCSVSQDVAPRADFQKALRDRPLTIVFSRPVSGILADIQDDLDFLGTLREMWCVEEEAGKTDEMQATGVRDGQRRQLLPCLHRRFSQDCAECDAWWAELCSRTDVDLCSGTFCSTAVAEAALKSTVHCSPARSRPSSACAGRGSFAPPSRTKLGGR